MVTVTLPDTLLEIIAEKARSRPDEICFQRDASSGYQAVTHRQYFNEINALARFFAKIGVTRGDRIGLLARPSYEWELADKATSMAGAVNVGLDYKSSPSDLSFVVDTAAVRGLVVEDEALLDLIPRVVLPGLDFIVFVRPPTVMPDRVDCYALSEELARHGHGEAMTPVATANDVATLIFTSGTTSKPKGIPLTHRQLMLNLPIWEELFAHELDGHLRTLSWVPLYNGTGRMLSSVCYYLDVEQYFVRDPMTLFDKMKEVGPTFVVMMPRITQKVHQKVLEGLRARPLAMRYLVRLLMSLYHRLPLARPILDRVLLKKLRTAIWGPRMKFMFSGSAPIDAKILRFFDGMGVETYEVYGLSELSVLVSMNRPARVRYGSVGEVMPGINVEFADDKEILVSGEAVIDGYWREGAADLFDAQGRLKTGDLGELRDGFLYIVGRKKEIIKTSTGQRISPVAVEQAYGDIPGIETIMVIGDQRKFLTALVVMEDGFAVPEEFAGQKTAYLDAEFEKRHSRLGANRQVKRFTVMPTPFSVESGEMTSTLKLRRRAIEVRHKDTINAMYED